MMTTALLARAEQVVREQQDTAFATWYDVDGRPGLKYSFASMWSEVRYMAQAFAACAQQQLSTDSILKLC